MLIKAREIRALFYKEMVRWGLIDGDTGEPPITKAPAYTDNNDYGTIPAPVWESDFGTITAPVGTFDAGGIA